MEQAKIKIVKTKNGFDIELTFSNGKKMRAPGFNIPNDANGKECSVERDKGQLVKVIIEGKTYTKSTKQPIKQTQKHKSVETYGKSKQKPIATHDTQKRQYDSQPETSNYLPTAPYNFIPLNSCVVHAESLPQINMYDDKNRHSGYINIEIKTKTPFYIRGTESSFFSPGGITKIPGSSIRGMVRTLIEVASWGKFTFFENERLYYRGVASPGRFGNDYRNRIGNNVNAGYLIYDEMVRCYKIQPAKIETNATFSEIMDSRIFKIQLRKDGKYVLCSGKMKGKENNWLINQPDKSQPPFSLDKNVIRDYKDDKNRNIEWDLLEMAKDKSKYLHGVPCFYLLDDNNEVKTFGHTRYFRLPYDFTIGEHVPDNLKQDDITDIPEAIFGKESKWATRVFFEDANIKPDQNNIFLNETSPKILSSPKPTTFQHYLKQPLNANKHTLNNWNDDLNSGGHLRGYKFYWHRDTSNSKQHSWITTKIELNKKDFDNFLKFKNNSFNNITKDWDFIEVKDVEDKIIIKRSFCEIPDSDFKLILKEYLLASDIVKKEADIKGGQYTVIQAVQPEVIFSGRIRFENLTKVELGALLFVLELPQNCCHKLGMAKPLGLGSVEITPELFLITRQERYSSLFNKDGKWQLGVRKEDNLKQFSQPFENHILSHIPEVDKNSAANLWNVPRMKALKMMLDASGKDKEEWLERTRYKEIEHPFNKNEFKDRAVLPDPEEV